MNKVTITVSGQVGSGKSALCGEIEILCKALGLPVEWIGGRDEKNLTGADWVADLEMYKPTVEIIESVERSAAHQPARASEAGEAVEWRTRSPDIREQAAQIAERHNYTGGGIDAARKIRALHAAPAQQAVTLTDAARDVLAERCRQVEAEGCTPADAAMLREANHSLADENDRLRKALAPFARLVSTDRLSWAMVEYAIEGDPEKQTFQHPQMQRAFNRAADLLRENVPAGEAVDAEALDLPEWVNNATPPPSAQQAAPLTDDARDAARYRWLRENWNNGCRCWCDPIHAPWNLDAAIDAALQSKGDK